LVLIALAALPALLVLVSCNRDTGNYPVLGKDGIATASLFETKEELLASWAGAGLKQTTVVLVDTTGGISRVPEDRVKELRKLLKKGAALTEGPGTGPMDFMYTAARSGMVSDVYWVIPFRLFDDFIYAPERVKSFLLASGLEIGESDVRAMKLEGGCLRGEVSGMGLRVCSYRTLPMIKAPVALVMDASFIPAMAFEYGASKLETEKVFFETMASKGLLVKRADITYGVAEGKTRPIHRYMAEEARQIIARPDTLNELMPPDPWGERNNIEYMYANGEGELMMEALKRPLARLPGDSSLRMLRVAALVRVKQYDRALEAAVELCQEDNAYCSGLVYLGDRLSVSGEVEKAALFYNAAEGVDTGGLRPGTFGMGVHNGSSITVPADMGPSGPARGLPPGH